MVQPSYSVTIEWAAGSFTELGDDVRGLQIESTAGGLFDGIKAGTARLSIDNSTNKYSPSNSASALNGLLIPGKAVKINATYSGSTYAMFTGKIDSFSFSPGISTQGQMTIEARDEIKTLNDQQITSSVFVATEIHSIVASVLTIAGVSSVHVHNLTSNEIPYAWFDDVSAKHAVQKLVDAGFYRTYVDGGGEFHFHGRYWDQEGSVVASLNEFMSFNYSFNDGSIKNKVTVRSEPRVISTSQATVAYITAPFLLPASGGAGFFLSYLDPSNREPAPAGNLVTPVSSSDYQAFENADGSGLDKTSVTSATVTFFGASALCNVVNTSAADVWLTKFQLRGDSIQRRPAVTSISEDVSSSQAVYGVRSYRLDNEFLASASIGQDYADFLNTRQKDPTADISIKLRNQFPNQLLMDVGGKAHLTHTGMGLAGEFTLDKIKHTIRFDKQGLTHDTQANVAEVKDQAVLFLDNALLGVLDSRKLGF